MGHEYKITGYAAKQAELPVFLQRQPEFIREDNGTIFLGSAPDNITVMVSLKSDHIYVCLLVGSREANALLGLITRRLLSTDEQIVITEL